MNKLFMKLNLQLFASMNVGQTYTSPVINIKPYGYSSDAYSMKFDVTLNSQSVASNSSNVTVTSYMKTNGNAWGWSSFREIYMERYYKANTDINYTFVNSTQLTQLPTNNAGVWVNCGSCTFDVRHDEQGNCTLYIMNHLSTASSSSYTFIPRDTQLESESLVLNALHKAPENVAYTMTETNQDLIDAGIANNVFVKDLSIKSFNITCDLFDSATVERYYIFNYLTPHSSDTLPLTINFKESQLNYNDLAENKVAIFAGVVDSMGGEGQSSPVYNSDLYDVIPYNKITLIETNTTVKRKGQVSGRVNLNVEGNYFNSAVGNKNQGGTYKPTIRYKFWKAGTSEPSTYDYTIPVENITISNGTFTVTNYDIGSSTETDTNYFDPDYSYRIKVKVEDYFTDIESEVKQIAVGKSTWSEFKDRVEFKKIITDNKDVGKYLKRIVLNPTLTFDDYYSILTNTDLGVDDCTKYEWIVRTANWENMFIFEGVFPSYITVRCWRISVPTNSTVSLIRTGSYSCYVTGIRISD